MIANRKTDRRIERTRSQLLEAFRDLVLDGGYSRITVADIISRANVGRSTFYEHFENKDDILRSSIAPLFEVLAGCVDEEIYPQALSRIARHFGENGKRMRSLLSGSAGRILTNLLADLVETRISMRARDARHAIPVRLIAAQIAYAQLGLLDAWLAAPKACTPESLAQAIHAGAYATSIALLKLQEVN